VSGRRHRSQVGNQLKESATATAPWEHPLLKGAALESVVSGGVRGACLPGQIQCPSCSTYGLSDSAPARRRKFPGRGPDSAGPPPGPPGRIGAAPVAGLGFPMDLGGADATSGSPSRATIAWLLVFPPHLRYKNRKSPLPGARTWISPA
jgi:hypothetical protein